MSRPHLRETQSVWVVSAKVFPQQVVWNLLHHAIKFTPPDGDIQEIFGLVHRVISRRHTAVGHLADFQGGPSRTGGYNEHI
jgi:hypothetical protein